MDWYQQKPLVTKNFEELTETYNAKYGNFDYSQDSRSLDSTFRKILVEAIRELGGLKVLVCGSNAGYEIEILSALFPTASFTALDISTKALSRMHQSLPVVAHVHANMESLPFPEKTFDVYLNCRAIHSTDVNIKNALAEAIRVTKLRIVISVSNGYRIDNRIVNGMYDYDSKKIDLDKPTEIARGIKSFLEEEKYRCTETSSEAEIFLVAQKL